MNWKLTFSHFSLFIIVDNVRELIARCRTSRMTDEDIMIFSASNVLGILKASMYTFHLSFFYAQK